MAPLLLLFILLLPFSTNSDSIGQYCDKDFQSPQIQTSITKVLSDLQTKAPISGFATSSSGQDQNIVFGLAQCRGDVSSADCTSCIDEATYKLKTICPKKADVRIWYDYCFMRYNTNNFIGKADTSYAVIYINVENATDPEKFDVEVGSLMRKVREKAVVAGSGGLGRGKSEFTPYVTIYGLVQCTRDLEPLTCAQCLSSAVEKLPEYCRYRKGCQVLYSSCIVRYEVYPFFFPLDDSTSSSQYGNYSNITSDVGQYLVVTVVKG